MIITITAFCITLLILIYGDIMSMIIFETCNEQTKTVTSLSDRERELIEKNYPLFISIFYRYSRKLIFTDYSEHLDLFYIAYMRAVNKYVTQGEKFSLSQAIEFEIRSVIYRAFKTYNAKYSKTFRENCINIDFTQYDDTEKTMSTYVTTWKNRNEQSIIETHEFLKTVLDYIHEKAIESTPVNSHKQNWSSWRIFEYYIINGKSSNDEFIEELKELDAVTNAFDKPCLSHLLSRVRVELHKTFKEELRQYAEI